MESNGVYWISTIDFGGQKLLKIMTRALQNRAGRPLTLPRTLRRRTKSTQEAPKRPQKAPKSPKSATRAPQERPKSVPRRPKSAPETPQTVPNLSQMEPKTLPNQIFWSIFWLLFSQANFASIVHRFLKIFKCANP